MFFAFILASSCGQQTGNSEKEPSDENSNDVNIAVAGFDSLAWADSLFTKGKYFYKEEISDSAIYYNLAAAEEYKQMFTSEGATVGPE